MRPAATLLPSDPDRYRRRETQLPRELARRQGGLSHQQANHVMGQQVDPQTVRIDLGTALAHRNVVTMILPPA